MKKNQRSTKSRENVSCALAVDCLTCLVDVSRNHSPDWLLLATYDSTEICLGVGANLARFQDDNPNAKVVIWRHMVVILVVNWHCQLALSSAIVF
jgi:hypothetical protein